MTGRLKRVTGALIVHGMLLTGALVTMLPLAWMVSTSLKETGLGLSTDIEWLPWQDVWEKQGNEETVTVLGARVRLAGASSTTELGIASLESRDVYTAAWLPGTAEPVPVEVVEWQIRPVLEGGEIQQALWVPYDNVTRRLAPHWSNYREALAKIRFPLLLVNTLTVTYLGTLGTILSASFVAYGFARFRFPGRDTLFVVLLSSLMLPPAVTMIPVYLVFRELGWIDTLLPLFGPAWLGLNAFAVFLFRQFFMTIPFDFDDAARIDGCGSFRIYRDILLPLSTPVVATVGIFTFTGFWLDFMTPLIYLNSLGKFTLSLGLSMFKDAYTVQWQYLMAATLVVSLPCVLLFLAGQRFFIRGVVMSGLKG